MTRTIRTLALVALASAMPALSASAQDTAPSPEPLKPWTGGTTHAANEVIGSRSGLGFSYIPPPTNDLPPPTNDLPELTVSATSVSGLVQVLNFVPPPTNDLPPGPVAVRIRLLPPGPTAEPRFELHVLDASAIAIFGPNGQSAALCGMTGGQ